MDEKENREVHALRVYGAFNFTRDKAEILRAILDSKENGTMIGLAVPFIGSGVFITAVEDVFLNDNETVIQVKYFDVSGRLIEKTRIALDEIVGACPLQSKWQNPFLKNLSANQ